MLSFKRLYCSLLFAGSLIFLAGSQVVDSGNNEFLLSGLVPSVNMEQGFLAQLSTDEQADKSSLGLIVSVKGKVKIQAEDGSFRPGVTGEKLFQGDQVFTGKRSTFQGIFGDESTMRLAPNSDFTINEYYWREAKGEAKADFSVENGTISFLASKISKVAPQNYKIHTATATIGIRGSAGELKVSSGGEDGPYTLARVSAGGHVLEVTSSLGTFVLDDPTRAIEVKADSVAWFPVTSGEPWVGDGDGEDEEDEDAEGDEEEAEEEATLEEEEEDEPEKETVEEDDESEVTEEALADEEVMEEVADAEDLVTNAMETDETEAKVIEVLDSEIGEKADKELAKTNKEESKVVEAVSKKESKSVEAASKKAPKTAKVKVEKSDKVVEAAPVPVIETPSVSAIVESVQEQVQKETSETVNTEAKDTAAVAAGISTSSSSSSTSSSSSSSSSSVSSLFDYLGKTSVLDSSLQIDLSSTTYPLPSFWVPATQQHTQISDVSWGKDASKTVSATDGLKIGDYWIEGTITPVASSGSVQTKLGVPDQYAYYTGLTVQTLQKAAGSSTDEIGLSVTGIDYGSKRLSSLAFFPSQGAIVVTGGNNVVDTSGFEVELVLYSLSGGNADEPEDGLFFSDSDSDVGFKGKFAGTGAKTIFSKYEHPYSSSQFAKALDISERTSSTSSITANTKIQVEGSTVGVVISSSGSVALIPQSEASHTLGVDGDGNFGMGIVKSGDKNYLGPIKVKAKDVKVFISKDAFFTTLDKEGSLSNYLSISNLDKENSYLAGVPGLNDFEYIGWGIWAVQESGGASQRLYGYTGFGRDDQLTPSVDITALKGSGTSNVVVYRGPAMGSVFNSGETPAIQFGTTVMNVDFGTGGINGAVVFSSDSIQVSRTAGTDLGSSFSGSATLNGGGSGDFTGQFFGSQAKEAAGTFSAINGSRVAIGAYGVKK